MSAHDIKFNQLKSFERLVRTQHQTLPSLNKGEIEVVRQDTFALKQRANAKVLCGVGIPVKMPGGDKRNSRSPNNITIDFMYSISFQPAYRKSAWMLDYLLNGFFAEGLNFQFWDTNGSEDWDDWTEVTPGVIQSSHDIPSQPVGEGRIAISRLVVVKFHR